MEVGTIARKQQTQYNEGIRLDEFRLIDADGENVGIVSRQEGLNAAYSAGLDLVLINANPKSPVARIMDYGKYQYEQSKREKAAKKAQKNIEVKEVQLKVTTEEHDFNTKVKHARRFLNDGNRVKVVIRFRGREMAHRNLGFDMMKNVVEAIEDIGQVDNPAKMEGRNMTMFLMPKADDKK